MKTFLGLGHLIWTAERISIGTTLNSTVRGHVNDLREFRNDAYAHVSKGAINDTDCKRLIGRVEAAFLGLNLDVTDIRAISHQQSFPTEELRLLVDQLLKEQEAFRALQEKSSALEEELHSEPKTFLGNLPAKPSHVIQERQSEVSMILKHMDELKTNSNGEITTVYISGNPGCGKSQIARMVGEAFYQHISPDELAFVATLNAETLDTLFNSYDSLSRALGCTEFAVGRISTSNDKIESMTMVSETNFGTQLTLLVLHAGLVQKCFFVGRMVGCVLINFLEP